MAKWYMQKANTVTTQINYDDVEMVVLQKYII